jgi:hypothetical protein
MGAQWTIVTVLTVIFVATLFRSTFGFGEALIAVPLLSLVIPVEQAVPLATLASINVAVFILIEHWRQIHFRTAGWLVFSTLFGIPLGLLLLIMVKEAIVKSVLGVVIIAFSLYCLIGRSRYELKNDRWAWLFGVSAGILGGAYGMNGPPLVVYGALRRWSPRQFRATLQGYFLPASIIGMCGYYIGGLWVPAVTHYYLWSLPLSLAAIFLGRAISQRMSGAAFVRFVHIGLLLVGTMLLIQALRRH